MEEVNARVNKAKRKYEINADQEKWREEEKGMAAMNAAKKKQKQKKHMKRYG